VEQIIANLLQDFERGKMSRRQLIQTLSITAAAVTVPALPALAAEPRKLTAIGINHYAYRTADYARTRDFYSDLLGMKVSNDDGTQCTLSFGSTVLKARNVRQPGDKPFVDHICYTLENWDEDAVEAELKRRGLEPRTDMGGGSKSFHISDPDGYDVEVTSPQGR